MKTSIKEYAAAEIESDDDSDAPNGAFTAILSAPTLDRDGDVFATEEWKTPLPERITIDVDHKMSAEGTIGSAKPYFDDDGNLCVEGTFASTPLAQTIRTLVTEGHLSTMSVCCMSTKDEDGNVTRELLNGAVVAIPSNREALILSSKAAATQDDLADGETDDETPAPRHDDMVQAIHDAAVALGAECVCPDHAAESDDEEAPVAKSIVGELVRESMVVGKSISGSVEDLQSAIGAALDSEYASLSGYTYIIATFLDAGLVVYRLYRDSDDTRLTLSRSFSVAEDGTVTLGEDVTEVELITTTEVVAAKAAKPSDDDESDEDDEDAVKAFAARLDALIKTSGADAGETDTVSPDSSADDSPAEPESAPSQDCAASDDAAQVDDEVSADEVDALALAARIRAGLLTTSQGD